MKKQSLALVAVLATAIAAPTMAADWFVGGTVGAQQNTYKSSSTAADILDPTYNAQTDYWKNDDKNAVYEVRVGAYLNDNNRIYSTYSYNSDDYSKQQSVLMSYDYLVGLGASNKLNWFIGASAGVNHTSPSTDQISSSNNFVWGGQTGLMYKINDNLSTEIGYRYLKQDLNETNQYSITQGMGGITNVTVNNSLNDSQQLYLGVDYRF